LFNLGEGLLSPSIFAKVLYASLVPANEATAQGRAIMAMKTRATNKSCIVVFSLKSFGGLTAPLDRTRIA
jgi:hypothetical protein